MATATPSLVGWVMAGVDLRTVQELGGWLTLSMVQRYAHLAPSHLVDAVERLVVGPTGVAATAELMRNFAARELQHEPAQDGVS